MPTKKKTANNTAKKKSASGKKTVATGAIDHVSIRMYCLGTGDCFVIKFCVGNNPRFTMMIDCGSCQGTPADFKPYIDDLATYVNNHLDLLIITHEHNDHVNGFDKCEKVFANSDFTIDEAWFAWTENPADPGGRAKKLKEKRQKMRLALSSAIQQFKAEALKFKSSPSDDYFKVKVDECNTAFLDGLNTLAEINLPEDPGAFGVAGAPLAGMAKIKKILASKKGKNGKKTHISYLEPAQSISIDALDDFKFHILGPPFERDAIFKEGKQGTDVYKKKLSFYESSLAVKSFLKNGTTDVRDRDIPFDRSYVASAINRSVITKISRQSKIVDSHSSSTQDNYNDAANAWRKIDAEWLGSAGSLALRLNSHINNTSLAIALEHTSSGKVILLPGDAEFGSWESWHAIENWKKKGKGDVPYAQDLLGRAIFYKVGHHLSYNGTALQLGIQMMPTSGLAAMATLDRNRIAKNWKSTMPNKFLLQELIKRCDGKVFIMDETEIDNPPSGVLDPVNLPKTVYSSDVIPGTQNVMYKQYVCKL